MISVVNINVEWLITNLIEAHFTDHYMHDTCVLHVIIIDVHLCSSHCVSLGLATDQHTTGFHLSVLQPCRLYPNQITFMDLHFTVLPVGSHFPSHQTQTHVHLIGAHHYASFLSYRLTYLWVTTLMTPCHQTSIVFISILVALSVCNAGPFLLLH